MKYLLHIDTATDHGMVAVSGNGEIIVTETNQEMRNHAATMNLMIEVTLNKANITFCQLSAIVVNAGPGSYTGLRIGMATAKGLCYALNIPLIADNRLILLANQYFMKFEKTYERYIVILTARSNEYFVSVHNSEFSCIFEPQHVQGAQLKDILSKIGRSYIITDVNSSDFEPLTSQLSTINNDININAGEWANYSFSKFNTHETEILSAAEPFYLKQVYTHN